MTLDIQQVAEGGVVGGPRCVIKTRPDTRVVALDRPPIVFDGVTWVPMPDDGASPRC